MTAQPPKTANATPLFLAWLACVAFVVYGSLVPLDFRPVPWDAALRRFQQMPMLRIGPESRADWISNIVLYVPVGFLSAAWFGRALTRMSGLGVLGVATLFSAGLAVGVEFTQIYFPPRTVALNDIAAEIMGSALGIVLANRSTRWLVALIGRAHATSRQLWSWLLSGYAVAYVIYCLFPFDFVLSGAELAEKLQSGAWGWWMADGHGSSGFIRLFTPVVETVLAVPLGWHIAGRLRSSSSSHWTGAALGASLGLIVEVTQFFMVSGISQGLSVLTRAAGMAAGVWLWQRRSRWLVPEQLAQTLRSTVPWAVPIYLLALAQVNHVLTRDWLDWQAGLNRVEQLHFLPFYYHYFTTEMQALHSLAAVAMTYAPIGLWIWALRASPATGAVLAMCLAGVTEALKLWLVDVNIHPDPTNLMIAAAAAWIGCRLPDIATLSAAEPMAAGRGNRPRSAQVALHVETGAAAAAPMGTAPVSASGLDAAAASTRQGASRWQVIVGLASVASALAVTIWFPVARPLIVGLLLASMAATWRRPALALTLSLAAVPSLALTPWSGRIFVDELDAVFAALLGVAMWRSPHAKHAKRHPDGPLALVYGLLAIALLVGIERALLPWQSVGAETLADLTAPINALRIAKGAVWAACFLAVMNRLRRGGVDIRPAIVHGLLGGLVLALAMIAWERAAFPGLLDFTSDYRVTGPFADMNIGGAYIECFLVVVTPFLAMAFLRAQGLGDRLLLALLACALAYGVMVTFSRSGYAAFAVAGLITLVVWSTARRATAAGRWAALALLVVMVATAAPVFFGSFSQARWAAVETDLAARVRHWEHGLQFRESDAATSWFGVGLGRFPEVHFWHSAGTGRRGSFRLVQDSDNTVLRLGSGHAMYVEQFVDVQPGKRYVLGIDVRSRDEQAHLRISVCERWMLTSYSCIELKALASEQMGAWKHQTIEFDAGRLAAGPWYARRPIKLAIAAPESGLSVDVDNLSLTVDGGRNLIANGDFSEGLDHWFFSVDDHLAWHIKSMPLALLFDLGWLGVIAFGLLIVTALKRSARHAWQGDDFAAASLAALAGFLVVGLFDTLIDTPRFMFLLLLLCGMAARRPHWKPPTAKA